MKNMNTIQIKKSLNGTLKELCKSPLGGFRGLLFRGLLLGGLSLFCACSDWLDVVPEGVATVDMAFKSRTQALKYLGTCYAYMPKDASTQNPAILGSDELWGVPTDFYSVMGYSFDGHEIALGMQNATNPKLGRWGSMYRALRACNTFLDNVDKVPDLPGGEREQWIAEITVLKAYYHFLLVQMYGPVPLVRENIPVTADISSVKVVREPVDDCFRYIVELLDEACEGDKLPKSIEDPVNDMGRITKTIAKALKAKVLVTAASPLFNGNNDQATLRNRDGSPLFNTNFDLAKWQIAAEACREAIEICREAEVMLYEYPNISYGDTVATDMTLRNAFSLRWNSEIIWANPQSLAYGGYNRGSMVQATMPRLNEEYKNSDYFSKVINIPLKMAHLFYTNHGVPLAEDNTRDMSVINDLRAAKKKDGLYIREGRITIDLHFDREPRFYAWVGFDGAIWFGAGRINDKAPATLWHLGFKGGETDGITSVTELTGYIPKKYIPTGAQLNSINNISVLDYAWPIMRLSDLYLLYAEAINEAEGGPNGTNSAEMFKYIDLVRKRAGLEGVKESWDKYTNNSQKYKTQTGMRDIIRQERMIELSFEGHRFWDVRRWKIATDICNAPLQGWNFRVSINDGTESEVNNIIYKPQLLHQQVFGARDYFWPISSGDLDINTNLVQNLYW